MIKSSEKLVNFETIYCSSNSVIYRAFDRDTNERVIVKTLNTELYDSNTLLKLKNEYKLLQRLQGQYVIKAYAFLNLENHFAMLIEDFGGISLDQYLIHNKIGLRDFLYIALEITKCLDHIHKNHVIHKDINPSNIVYNPDNKVIKLIDFGIASEFYFANMEALNPLKLEGRLPYISPEQTGRMNRPVDYRTDFYSLGVTLYELACGILPLISEDPAEIVHFHIAKMPLPAYEVNPAVPKTVSAIIAKLMAKMPEERYKNAHGIMCDLDKCIKQLNTGKILEFKLGSDDVTDRFEVPKKLYGRKNELQSLLALFANVREGKTEIILIGGYAGVGKTSLVNELHKPIIKEHGIFISGKYDQYSRNTPYSACFHAIDQFCSYILSEPEIEIKRWKKRIVDAIGSNGGLITEVVPRLGLIIGEQPRLGELTALEKQTRFKTALKNLIAAIAAPEHPVVLFIDDVHWADMASLDLFAVLLTDPAVKGLMFIGTYRDNEVNASHMLIRTLEKIEKNNAKPKFIRLKSLSLDAVAHMIADVVNRPRPEIFKLTAAVYERTLGNPLYTVEFLKFCNEKRLLYYDKDKMRWQWDQNGIYHSQISDNVVEYLISRVETLPPVTRNLVKIAACVGNHFDLKVLSEVAQKAPEDIKEGLKPAIIEEMVYVAEKTADEAAKLRFQFCHDKFQQAAYQALSEDIKTNIHLNIARYYEANEALEGATLFIVADHYAKSLNCLNSIQETEKVIEIFFQTAHAANLSSAYDTSREYLELIMDIAPEHLQKDNSFWLRLYREYHLALFSLARFEELDQIYVRVEVICENPLDLVDCCCLQLISLSNRSRYQEGFALGIALLEKLGIKYPQEQLADVVEAEFKKYCEYEHNGSIENIDQREMLNDTKGKAIAKILNRIVPAAQFFNPLAAFWATLVNANLMVENGITEVALEMSWGFFMGVIAYKNDFRCGNILAEKAMHIVQREGYNAELYRMYHFNGLTRCHWFEPVEKDIYYAHEAYKGNLQNGEFEFSCYSFFTSLAAILESCHTISEMQDEVDAALSFASKMGNLYGIQSFISFRQIVKALRGETDSYGSFNDKDFDEKKHIIKVKHNAIGLAYYYIYRSLSAVIFGDFQTAFWLTEKAVPLLPYIASFYTAALLRFLHSLAICRKIDNIENSAERSKYQKILTANQEWMYQRAQDAPGNYQHLYDLIDAEMKGLERRYAESLNLYEKSIREAKENKRSYHCALACELAGRHFSSMGIERVAGFYLKEAYSVYLAWGADGKTRALKQKYPHILFSEISHMKMLTHSSGCTTLTKSVDMINLTNSLDINAVIKANQAISGEVEKKKLIEIIMNIIIENSGASRGYMLLRDGRRWILSSYELTNNIFKVVTDNIEILLESKEHTKNLPITIVSYVIRTVEPLIIGNVENSRFYSDRYFADNIACSVMCLPILLNKALKGVIYLENDLLTEAFTRERLEVVNIFAGQAAISLENAMLYAELEEKVKERTKQLEERTAELAVAKDKAEAANRQLEARNLQLQQEVTVRKRVEKEQKLNLKQLRQSEERFYKIFNNSPVMMSIKTLDEEVYIDVNARWEEITGYNRREVIGRSELDIWEDTPNWSSVIKELNHKGVRRNAERTIRTKYGELRTFIISQTVVNLNNTDCWLSAFLDISERKKMEQKMARLDRLNIIGEMAASIGHEVRNPMTAVRGYLQLVKQQEGHSGVIETFDLLIEELDRANAIITEFLSLARDKIINPKMSNINTIVAAVQPLIDANAMARDMNIRMRLDKVPDAFLDEKEIRQLLLNLCQNGLEAMSKGGTLFISTYSGGNEVVLMIRDQGCGISPEILEKIGDPFITTKEQGTGLGLSVCYGIANRHGASIDIETGKEGTIVKVKFPLI